jgi:hypothetical protein
VVEPVDCVEAKTTDLPIVTEPIEAQNNIDLPIVAEAVDVEHKFVVTNETNNENQIWLISYGKELQGLVITDREIESHYYDIHTAVVNAFLNNSYVILILDGYMIELNFICPYGKVNNIYNLQSILKNYILSFCCIYR